MAVIHEGWVPRSKSKKPDYCLKNPTYISGLEDASDFWEQVRGIVGILKRMMAYVQGKDLVKDLVLDWRSEFSRRRAMMEELDRLYVE